MSKLDNNMLGIKKSDWHYRYFVFLKKIFILDGYSDSLDVKNLCSYSHTIFWLSALLVILSPCILLSWLILKISRSIYKYISYTKIGRLFIDWFEKGIKIGDVINDGSDLVKENPIKGSILITVITSIIIASIIGIFIVIFIGVIPFLIFAIPKTPYAICVAITYIGWGLMWAYWAIGIFLLVCLWMLKQAAFYIGVWFVWMAWLKILFCLGVALVAIACASILGLGIVWFFTSPKTKKIRDWLSFKFNGFQKAREESTVRKEEKKKEKEEILASNKICPHFSFKDNKVFSSIGKKWGKVKSLFVGKKVIVNTKVKDKVKERKFKLMSGISILWELLKSVKSGICPMVELVDDDDIVEDKKD